MESNENPFTANGILSQKADYIISHSTITRTEIHIADPDTIQEEVSQPEPQHPEEDLVKDDVVTEDKFEDVVQIVKTQPTESAAIPVENNSPATPVNKEHSKKPVTVKAETVEAEVRKADVAEPQHAEEVRLKKKKRCCSVL